MVLIKKKFGQNDSETYNWLDGSAYIYIYIWLLHGCFRQWRKKDSDCHSFYLFLLFLGMINDPKSKPTTDRSPVDAMKWCCLSKCSFIMSGVNGIIFRTNLKHSFPKTSSKIPLETWPDPKKRKFHLPSIKFPGVNSLLVSGMIIFKKNWIVGDEPIQNHQPKGVSFCLTNLSWWNSLRCVDRNLGVIPNRSLLCKDFGTPG